MAVQYVRQTEAPNDRFVWMASYGVTVVRERTVIFISLVYENLILIFILILRLQLGIRW